NGSAIGFHRLLQAAGFVEDVTEIKESQSVVRIDLNRPAIVAFGFAVILLVVEERSQIDARCSMFGIELQHATVHFQGFLLARRIFFDGDSRREQLSRGLRDARRSWPGL